MYYLNPTTRPMQRIIGRVFGTRLFHSLNITRNTCLLPVLSVDKRNLNTGNMASEVKKSKIEKVEKSVQNPTGQNIKKRLVWIDCEMSGLDPDQDKLLEV